MLSNTRMPRTGALLTAVLMVVALLGFIAPANAAAGTTTWTGAGDGTTTSDAKNWTDGAPTMGDDLVFPAGVDSKNVSINVPGLTYGSVTIEDAGYRIAGFALQMDGQLTSTYSSGKSEIFVELTTLTGQVDVAAGGTLDVLDAVTTQNALTATGGGTLRLSGNSTYTAKTVVDPGTTVQVDGTLASVPELAGGTLTGSGTLNGAGMTATRPSTISPGTKDGPGVLRYGSNTGLTLPGSSTLHVDIDGPAVGTGYDQLKLTSGSTVFNPNGATLDVDLGYIPAVNTSFQIVAQSSGVPVTGRFNGISQFGSYTSGPVTFSVGYFTSGVILTVTAVNIPTATWDGGGSTNFLTDAANWAGDVAPTPGSALVFPTSGVRYSPINDFPDNTKFDAITINDDGYTISGNRLATRKLQAAFSTGTSTLAVDIDIDNTDVAVATGGTLALTGVLRGTNLVMSGAGTTAVSGTNYYSGTTTVKRGTVSITNSRALGNFAPGDGTVVENGGVLEIDGNLNTTEPLTLAGSGASGSGALFNKAGVTQIAGVTLAGDAAIGTAENTTLVISGNTNETTPGSKLTKVGGGTLDFRGTASHTGGTRVAAGSLATPTATTSTVDVDAGALFLSGGTAGDITAAGGIVAAGDQGSAKISNARALTLSPAATLVVQVNGKNPGTGYSQLALTQTADLGSATLALPGRNFTPSIGDTLTIITSAAPVTGTFKNLPEGAYFTYRGSTQTYRISYATNDGKDVTLTAVSPTSTALTVSPNPVDVGTSTTLTATVAQASATGTVTFKEGTNTLDTKTVVNGKATLALTFYGAGPRNLTATYNGDGLNAPSTSSVTTLPVNDPPPETTIDSGPVDGSTGNPTSTELTFSSTDTDVASYECSLEGGAFAACKSPAKLTGLSGGKHTFAVRAVDTNGGVDPTPAAVTWTVTGIFDVTGGVTVTGTPKVGQTLTATSDVTTTPSATTVTGQWYRGADPISGATGTTYTLTNDDVSSTIIYRETRARADYENVFVSSSPTDRVTGGVITLAKPTIGGNPAVDGVLTATPGAVTPSTATVTLVWNVDSEPTTTTGGTYTVKPGDVGKPITVTATATLTDHDTKTATSDAATGTIAVFADGPTATITGVLQVGQTLTAGEGAPSPAADSYEYQWFAGDTAVTGATGRTFTLTPELKGKAISVRVTAARTGYTPASSTSTPTAPVVTDLAPALTFDATSKALRLGQGTTLSWSSTDAVMLMASDSWFGVKAADGSETVTPTATGPQTYTLTATNGSGTTTAQVVVQVGLPAAKLSVKARSKVEAGRKLTVATKGLAPREAYTVYFSGKKVATGTASAAGTAKKSVRVPSSNKAGKRTIKVIGSLGDRTGARTVKVIRTSKATISLADRTVRASDDQRITVRGLRASEKVTVTYQGKRISPRNAKATGKGVYRLSFDVGTTWGNRTVKVTGSKGARVTSKTFTVVSRCSGGVYSCP